MFIKLFQVVRDDLQLKVRIQSQGQKLTFRGFYLMLQITDQTNDHT